MLGFAGQVTEPGSDLQSLRACWYDPKTAQFITRDPREIETGQPYLYASGNPTMYTDPTGEIPLGDFGGGFANGASMGQVKPDSADSCSWKYFIGQQLGGVLDPLKKIKAGKTAISGALGVTRAGRAGRSEGTTVSRAVGDEELKDIASNGVRVNPDGRGYQSIKLFTTSSADAARQARSLNRVEGQVSTIVRVHFPAGVRTTKRWMDSMDVIEVRSRDLGRGAASALSQSPISNR